MALVIVGDGGQIEFLDLAQDIGLGETEAGADQSALLLFVVADVDPEFGEVDAAFLRPVEHRGLERLGAHDRAVDLGLGKSVEILDDVLVGDLERVDGGEVTLLDDGAEGFGRGDGRGAAEGEIASLGDPIQPRVVGVTIDAEGEPQGVAAGDGPVLAETVGVFDLPEVRAGLSRYRRHEEFGGFLRVVPGHGSSACEPRRHRMIPDPALHYSRSTRGPDAIKSLSRCGPHHEFGNTKITKNHKAITKDAFLAHRRES